MKHVLSVDVAKFDKGYSFTLHYHKKATIFEVNNLIEGFRKVMELIEENNQKKEG